MDKLAKLQSMIKDIESVMETREYAKLLWDKYLKVSSRVDDLIDELYLAVTNEDYFRVLDEIAVLQDKQSELLESTTLQSRLRAEYMRLVLEHEGMFNAEKCS